MRAFTTDQARHCPFLIAAAMAGICSPALAQVRSNVQQPGRLESQRVQEIVVNHQDPQELPIGAFPPNRHSQIGASKSRHGPASFDWRPTAIKMGVSVIVMSLGCLASLVYGKRWLISPSGMISDEAAIKKQGNISFPSRCFVHLIRVDGQAVLVGIDRSGIKSIVPLSPKPDAPFSDAIEAAAESLHSTWELGEQGSHRWQTNQQSS